MAKKKAAKAEMFRMNINGYELSGEKLNGKWAWKCPSFPELETLWQDSVAVTGIIGDFVPMTLREAAYVAKGEF